MRDAISIRLPYPPTMNTYWRNVKGKTLISAKGRSYRERIGDQFLVDLEPVESFGTARLRVLLEVTPPDKRRRDLDNIQKPILDALEFVGLYDDDEQIDDLHTVRRMPDPPGCVHVTIERM